MKTHETRSPDEKTYLSADFAARVLRKADAVIARRRHAKQIMTGTAAVVALLIAITTGLQLSMPTSMREFPESTGVVVLPAVWASTSSQDALTYLLPNAAPVDRFVERYAAANYGVSVVGDTASGFDFTVSDAPQ